MKKKNLFVAVLAMLMVCVMVFVCVSCGKSNTDTNNNTQIEQPTQNTENENNPGSENSNQQGGNVENEESTTPENNGGNVDNSDDTDNGSENTGDDNVYDDNNVGGSDTNEDTDNNINADDKLVGIGLYVCGANETLPYKNGQKINGVMSTLSDGRSMYTFGNFEAMYVIDAGKVGRYNTWDLNCEYSSNLVYCNDVLNERKDGTFFASASAYYVNMSGKNLVYYVGSIYQSNDGYYLVVNNEANSFRKNQKVMLDESIYLNINGVDVEISVYFRLDTNMVDGVQNEIELVFYNSYGDIVNTQSYTNRTVPNEIVWKANYSKVIIHVKYEGEVCFKTTVTRGDILNINNGYDWNTVIDNVGYHHNISWIIEN